MKELLSLLIVFVLSFNSIAFASSNCTDSSSNGETRSQVDDLEGVELSPLDIVILDLESIPELLDQGNKKVAVSILKSPKKQLRKVKDLDKKTKRKVGRAIRKALKYAKMGKNNEAKNFVSQALSQLNQASGE